MISVVIPSYNRRDGMLDLLRSLSNQKDAVFETIVVDDKSPDNSVEAIRNAFPEVRLFVNEKNGGPAVSRNKGIKEAKGDIIVGFDSDVTVPDSHCIKKVSDFFECHPEVGGLAFRLLQPDGKSEDIARWWHPVPIETFANESFETNYFSGTGYAFRKASILESGMYPEILYMHYEEVELAYRFLDKGYKLVYTPKISVVHHEGQVSRRSEIKTFYKNRNQILLALATMPSSKMLVYVPPRLAFGFLRAIKDGHILTFIKMIKSARELGKIRLSSRKPLSKQTWRYMSDLKKGLPFKQNKPDTLKTG